MTPFAVLPNLGKIPLLSGQNDPEHTDHMRISRQAIREFERLWKTDHPNQSLSKKELRQMAIQLLRLVSAVYQPMDKEADRDRHR